MVRNRPAALLFDMDGLLIDSERVALASLDHAAQKLSLEFPHHVAQRLIGLGRDAGMNVVQQHFGEEFPIEAFYAHWESDYLERVAQGVPAKEGVAVTLEYLVELRMPIAVATSTRTSWALKKLTNAGLDRFFDHVVGRDAVAQGKPAPDLYLEAARRLGVDASDCWAFEDSLPGLRAAHASGARTHWVPDLAMIEPHDLPSNVETIESLAAVCNWLAHAS
jgi:HAD superfamily hydrolase (TIGR01509 family)